MPLFGPPNIEKLTLKGDTAGLTKALGYRKDPNVRRAAAQLLGHLREERAVEALINNLKDENSSVREAAAEALGRIREPRAIEPLIGGLEDESLRVREAATDALRMLGWQPNTGGTEGRDGDGPAPG